jgi:ADP-ribose pyrophosphatase YjhB (NUDIX family)
VPHASADPRWIRRRVLTVYGRLPRRIRLALLHTFAPSHTVGSLCFLEHEGRLLLLRQVHRRGWTLPGGLVDRGENAEQAAVREVAEETGLRIRVGQPLTVVVDPRARRVDVLFHVPVDSRPDVVPASEAFQAAWLTLAEAAPVDDATATAFAAFVRARTDGDRTGAVLPPPQPQP